MKGVPFALSMRAIVLWVMPMLAAISPCVKPACVRAEISSRAISNAGVCATWVWLIAGLLSSSVLMDSWTFMR